MKDIKIENNDIVIYPNGYPKTVEGFDVVAQQIETAASFMKGSFAYDRNLGLFAEEPDFDSDNIVSTIESLINEVLVNTGVYVTVNSLRQSGNDYLADITVSDGFREKETEVKLWTAI